MNNEQFRKFIAKQSLAKTQDAQAPPANAGTKSAPNAALGSRLKASIPMTPRTVKGSSSVQSEFARQVAERGAATGNSKKAKISVPKGTKLAAGYIDRTKERYDEEQDDKARRIRALEESMKLGQIDEEAFEKLRDQITGGELGATHLVRGLDRRLLERVRRGEDLNKPSAEDEKPADAPKDIDDEFEDLEKQEVQVIIREDTVKQGQVAPKKLSRNEILAQFRAERAAAKAAKQSPQRVLGSGFRKIGQRIQEGVRLEIDQQGREVLIVTDKDGNVKRKVRKGESAPLLGIDPQAEVLGIEVPDAEIAPQVPLDRESDDDIFEGVPDYDPLAGLSSSEDDADGAQGDGRELTVADRPDVSARYRSRTRSPTVSESSPRQQDQKLDSKANQGPRNYFTDDPATFSVLGNATNPLSDPTILATLTAKARQIDPSRFNPSVPSASDARNEDEAARLKRKAAMLAGRDRDLDDIDMGFGGNRADDADEMENDDGMSKRAKLSEWKGLDAAGDDDDDEDQGGKGKGGMKRKRGSKKKKGDKNSVADVLRVMDAQKSR